jgi:DNA-binding response OmpR family regulator
MKDTSKILLLEDEPILAQTIEQFLKREGYAVTCVEDGEEAFDATYESTFDLYLFDVNVPLVNGMDVLHSLREAGDKTPAFFITALIDIDSISKGFDSGCDDYIKKPFKMSELLVRIRAILKRRNPVIQYRNITFDLFENRVYQNEEEVPLGTVEKAIFGLLIRNIAITIDKSSFLDHMYKPSESGLRVVMNKLRRIFSIDIISIKGIGYRLEKS